MTKNWLEITTNINTPIQGVPAFIEACKNDYDVVQHHKIWTPAYSDYTELIIQLFSNISIAGIIAEGLVWDTIKKITQKLFAVIRNYEALQAQNIATAVDFQEFILQFDDIKITFHGLGKGAYSQVSSTFQSLIKALPALAKLGITDIIEISLPLKAEETEQGTEYILTEFTDPAHNPYLWHIKYDHGLNIATFNSATEQIIN